MVLPQEPRYNLTNPKVLDVLVGCGEDVLEMNHQKMEMFSVECVEFGVEN